MAFVRVTGGMRHGNSGSTPLIFIYIKPVDPTFEGGSKLAEQLREALGAADGMHIWYDHMDGEISVIFEKSAKNEVRNKVVALKPELRDELLPGFL